MTTAALLAARPNDQLLAGPLGSFEAYAERISRIPVLTREQEVALFSRLQQHNDLTAARELVLSHLRFVLHIARGYVGYGLPLGDLVQEGNVGLMKAVKRFDPDQGVRLVSFAVHWIRAEIHDYVLRNWRLVKIATTQLADRCRDRRHGARSGCQPRRSHRDGAAPVRARPVLRPHARWR